MWVIGLLIGAAMVVVGWLALKWVKEESEAEERRKLAGGGMTLLLAGLALSYCSLQGTDNGNTARTIASSDSEESEQLCQTALSAKLGGDTSVLGHFDDTEVSRIDATSQRVSIYLAGSRVGEMCPARWKGSCVINGSAVESISEYAQDGYYSC